MTNKEALSKETRENAENEVVKNTKESLQSLKNDVEGIVRCSSWQELVNRIPEGNTWTDKKIYQVMLGNNRMEFYGNGRVNTISPDKTSRMASRQKKHTTIYIDGRAVDLEKGKYVWKDKETNEYMSQLGDIYLWRFRQKNPTMNVDDSWLRNRLYNLSKNGLKKEIVIRDLSADKPWKITQVAANLGNRPDYAKWEVPHTKGGETMYLHTDQERVFFDDFIAEISHCFNEDGGFTTTVGYWVDLIKTWFDQHALYSKVGTIEYYAHSVTEKIIESYLMLDEKWQGTKNESFETVRNNYWDAYTKLYLLGDEYNLDMDMANSLFKTPYEKVKDQKALDRFIDKLKKKVLAINAEWGKYMQEAKVKQLIIAYPMCDEKEIDEKIEVAISMINRAKSVAKGNNS